MNAQTNPEMMYVLGINALNEKNGLKQQVDGLNADIDQLRRELSAKNSECDTLKHQIKDIKLECDGYKQLTILSRHGQTDQPVQTMQFMPGQLFMLQQPHDGQFIQTADGQPIVCQVMTTDESNCVEKVCFV